MSLLNYHREDMLADYSSCCQHAAQQAEISELWPPTCASLRDPVLFSHMPFTLQKQDVQKVSLGNHHFYWLNAKAGHTLSLLMDIEGVNAISACDRRLDFIHQGIKSLAPVCQQELAFIADFISAWVWLSPAQKTANYGSASFYEIPHVAFISDAALFFIPPCHSLSRELGVIGLIENLYHEALHHQVHSYCAFKQPYYCKDNLDHNKLWFPYRTDRSFSYAQAFNACYVYGEIIRFRGKMAEYLAHIDNTAPLSEAISSARMMWLTLAGALFAVKEAFLPPWQGLIETWYLQAQAESPQPLIVATDK
jgi:hypothetical protein